MPRKRMLKTNRNQIDENSIKQAITGYFNGTYSEREAARVHGIKRTTLQSRVKKILQKKTKEEYLRHFLQNLDDSDNESEEDSPKYSNKYTNRQVFTTEQESELETYIKRCSDLNYGLTYVHIQKLAYEYASALPNCQIPPEWHQERQAKDGWRRGFMARHPTLSLRKPESTSLSRSTAFNKFKVDQFFGNLQKVLERFKFPPERIFNLDETGVTTVMKPVKVVSATGKKQVSQAASGERGELVTFVGIISASGQSLPPVFVFPRIRNVKDFVTDAPVSSLALGNKSGWMTAELFPAVLKHIVKHTRCSPVDPILLLVDNHESHVSLTSVKYCKENGVVLLNFAPHTTHRMQPLDIGVFGPFKNFCNIAFNDWMVSNPGKTITVKNIPELTHRAYLKAFTSENIINSFKKPGIWPLNRLAFSDDDFTPSFVTDQPLLPKETAGDKNNNIENEHVENENDENNKMEDKHVEKESDKLEKETEDMKSTRTEKASVRNDKINILSNIRILPATLSCSGYKKRVKITPESIRPFPKAIRKETKSKRTPGISRIYTDTPETERLEKIEQEKQNKRKGLKNVFKNNLETKENKQPRKKLKVENHSRNNKNKIFKKKG